MSKKDYEALAKVLSQWSLPMGLLGMLCDWLEIDNPRFDRERFLDAAVTYHAT